MRSTRHIKTKKSACRRQINKRSYKPKSAWGCTQNLSNMDLENINEILRVHKTQQAEGKGAWKVVPKDSCEVYKNRRKRQTKSSCHEEDNDENSIRTTDSEESREDEKKIKRNGTRIKKELPRKSRRCRKSYKHRHSRQSPESTSNSTSSTYSSCFSSSEMDYE